MYMDLDSRQRLIEQLYDEGGGESAFCLDTEVVTCDWDDGDGVFRLELEQQGGGGGGSGGGGDDGRFECKARAVIVAGGRFWPLQSRNSFVGELDYVSDFDAFAEVL